MQLRHKCHNFSRIKKTLFRPNSLFSYHIYTIKFSLHTYLYSEYSSKTKGMEHWYISVISPWIAKFLGN